MFLGPRKSFGGAPGHGKDVVDGLNAVDKNYLFKLMSRIKVPEAEEGEAFFAAHGATVSDSASFAKECQRLLSLRMRKDGVSSQSKSSKHESNRKWTERKYHVQIKDDVRHFGVKMGCSSEMFPELPFADLTKKHHGARGLEKHYHFRLDPKLGQGKCAIRRIPCACEACMNQLDKKWIPGKNDKEQP